jgi:hypothetical protein
LEWRSILKGTKHVNFSLVARGLTRRLYTPRGPNMLTFANDLTDPVTGQWDKDLIEQNGIGI